MILAVPGHEPSLMDFIQRDQPTTDEQPPWVGISFKWAVDSDELAELLKKAYPDCRTHRERKHKAAIDFFIQEFDRMRAKGPATPTAAPPMDPGHRNGSQVCTGVSPDRSRPASVSEYTSPSLSGSLPSPSIPERARLGTKLANDAERSPVSNPAPQQLVWNAHNGQPMRPKTKRKMTMDEREAYKKTREQGACEPCRKQKARCTHTGVDQPLVSVEQSNRLPRKKSSPPSTYGAVKAKKMKVERPQQPVPQSSEVSQVHPSPLAFPRNTPGEPPTEAMTDLGSQNPNMTNTNRYVNTSPMEYFQDPWSPYPSRNFVGTSPAAPVPGCPPSAPGFSLDMSNLGPADYHFSEGFPFFPSADGGIDEGPKQNREPT